MPVMVSAIVLTKNSQRHIETCMESLLQQFYDPMEIIVVDAGSEDKTIDLVHKCVTEAKTHSTTIVEAPGMSIGIARQIGLRHATGKILAYVDSDVELPSVYWTRNMLVPLQDKMVAGVQTLARCRPDDWWLLKRIHSSFEYKNQVIDLEHYEPVGTSHLLLRKKAVLEAGGFKNMNFGEDTDLTHRIMELGYKFVYLPEEKCYHYHIDGYRDYIKKRLRSTKYSLQSRAAKLKG